MKTREDIDAYLQRFGQPYRELNESTWLVGDTTGMRENIVVAIENELCLLRMKVLDLSQIEPGKQLGFFRTLLELNATDLVHGAYGIADEAVLLTASLLLSTLDFAELAGALEDFMLAIANHHSRLAEWHSASAEGGR